VYTSVHKFMFPFRMTLKVFVQDTFLIQCSTKWLKPLEP